MRKTRSDLEGLIDLLKSPDHENKVLALSIIDQIPFKENIAVIGLAYKLGCPQPDEWAKYAPVVYEKVKNTGMLFSTIPSYLYILNLIGEAGGDAYSLQMVYDEMAKGMLENLVISGYKPKSLTIKLELDE
jgi:hypothetical protein